jgi:hypothetical protein
MIKGDVINTQPDWTPRMYSKIAIPIALLVRWVFSNPGGARNKPLLSVLPYPLYWCTLKPSFALQYYLWINPALISKVAGLLAKLTRLFGKSVN